MIRKRRSWGSVGRSVVCIVSNSFSNLKIKYPNFVVINLSSSGVARNHMRSFSGLNQKSKSVSIFWGFEGGV